MKQLIYKIRMLMDSNQASAEVDKMKQRVESLSSSFPKLSGALSKVISLFSALGVGVFFGKMLAAPFEKLNESLSTSLDTFKSFKSAQAGLEGAKTFDAAVSGMEGLKTMAQSVRDEIETLNKSWISWTANLLTGGGTFEEMRKLAEKMDVAAGASIVNTLTRQAIEADPVDKEYYADTLRDQNRDRERAQLRALFPKNLRPFTEESRQYDNARDALEDRFSAEDRVRERNRAKKADAAEASGLAKGEEERSRRNALKLSLELAQAVANGNTQEATRLRWLQAYTAALNEAKAVNIENPEDFARESANTQFFPASANADLAAKQNALALELDLAQAVADGNAEGEKRLRWALAYNAALDKAREANLQDPEDFARRTADVATTERPKNTPDTSHQRKILDLEIASKQARQSGDDTAADDLQARVRWLQEYKQVWDKFGDDSLARQAADASLSPDPAAKASYLSTPAADRLTQIGGYTNTRSTPDRSAADTAKATQETAKNTAKLLERKNTQPNDGAKF